MRSLVDKINMKNVIITVKEIRGKCVVFEGGEKIVIEGAKINLEKTDKICIYAPIKLGLA